MIKFTKMIEWANARIDAVASLKKNTNLTLTVEGIISACGTPTATAFIDSGGARSEGDVLLPDIPVTINIIAQDDDDWEGAIEDLCNEIESNSNAYPDFYESGDVSHSPATVMGYKWNIYPPTAEMSGIIIIVFIINFNYIAVANRG